MKTSNSISPNVDPLHTPVMIGLQVDFVLLIITLAAWQFRQFSVHLSNLYLIGLSMNVVIGDGAEILAKVKANDTYYFIHQTSHFIKDCLIG